MSECSEERMRFLLKMGIETVFPKLNRNSREEWEDNEMFNGGQNAFRALPLLVISFLGGIRFFRRNYATFNQEKSREKELLFSFFFFYKDMSVLR